MKKNFDVIVAGGGLVGMAIAYGLARKGLACLVLDEGDTDFRAARGNFGLVWVQGKGAGFPPYADWTMRSAELWSRLREELEETSGLRLGLEQEGGIDICLSQDEFDRRKEMMDLLQSHQNGRFKYEMLDRKDLLDLQPDLGEDVIGASFSRHDGHVNPLYLLRSLHHGLFHLGGEFRSNAGISSIRPQKGGFTVHCARGDFSSDKIVLAAGLGNRLLAPMVGLSQPLRPQKGQILVTEKTAPMIHRPMTLLRQTQEGSIMIGDSKEEVGFDISSTPDIMANIAKRACRTMPRLRHMRIIRSWGALRVMSPDGYPVYDQSQTCPGAFAVACHSGVTLAAAHCFDLASDIAKGQLADTLAPFSERRFDVSQQTE
ncbi:NAD(P)/FAD-dependent oxidoreductase [Alphaproteobacteria bacterium LSUCC0684]